MTEVQVSDDTDQTPAAVSDQDANASAETFESSEKKDADSAARDEIEELDWPELVDDEEVVKDVEWFRQCATSPNYWDEATQTPSAMMFHWNDADQGRMSGSCPPTGDAPSAYQHRVEVEGKASAGTWSVPYKAISDLQLRLVDDSRNLPAPPASPPGHTYLDMRLQPTGSTKPEKRARESIRSRLLANATRVFAP